MQADESENEASLPAEVDVHCKVSFSDDLFVKHSVEHVREVEKEIRHNTELKREELRLMVGRRYRDIIEAADDLHTMHNIAEDALGQLQALRSGISRLQQYPVIPKVSLPLGAQLRSNVLATFLADLCDMFSALSVQADWATLGWLFSLAVYVDSALIEFHGETPNMVRTIWRDVYASRCKLTEKCEQAFSPRLDADEVCQMLCCLMLMEKRPLDQLPSMFYSWCFKIFKGALLSTDLSFTEQIGECVTTWFRTIMLAHEIFYTDLNRVSLLVSTLNSFHTCKPAEIDQYIAVQRRAHRQCLEELLASFRPVDSVSPSDALIVDALHRETAAFLTKSLDAYTEDVGKTLQSLNDLKSLVERRESIQNALACVATNPKWTKACEELFGSDKERVMSIFYMPISQRAEQVVKAIVQRVFEAASDFDSIPNDLDCLQATWAASNDQSELHIAQRLLSMPSEVLEKCQFVDGEYKTMLDALDAFCTAYESSSQLLQEPLVTATVAAVQQFAERCQHVGSQRGNVTAAVHCAKFCQGLLTCCDHFKSAFFVRSKHTSAWHKITTVLNQLSEHKYSEWILAVAADVGSEVKENLHTQCDVRTQMENLLRYESVTIEDDQGVKNSSSKMLIPCSLSRWAFRLLHRMSRIGAAVGIHSVPRHLVKQLTHTAISSVVEAMDVLLESEDKPSQLLVVQLLFDLQVLTTLLLDDQSTKMKKRCRQTISTLKGRVDAFDLELMTPRLKANVKQQTLRLVTLFDAIVADGKYVTRQLNGTKYQPDDQSQMLMLNSQGCRFAKLPICDDWKMTIVAGNKEGETNSPDFH
ncbi:oligomeric Golgi complex subunit 1 [Trichuris trichiura]|uniref:Conserved oligomeric Golgi complex subunit 1 n=1 Tax=Trichuris trichiura TaxID=36087 RepID=A0A077YXH1_TRITR|nr:oligomeric Golgi complex subunit 1 [Trichuris trichiura]